MACRQGKEQIEVVGREGGRVRLGLGLRLRVRAQSSHQDPPTGGKDDRREQAAAGAASDLSPRNFGSIVAFLKPRQTTKISADSLPVNVNSEQAAREGPCAEAARPWRERPCASSREGLSSAPMARGDLARGERRVGS